jgi:Tfp pilus assembly protein FimT
MNSKQIFMIVAVIAALSMVVMIASPVMAQNMTGGNMTGKVSSIDSNFLARSGCPVDAEGIERCPPSQELTDSNRDTNENGNGNDDASDDGNEEDSSDGNENGEN